MHGAVDRLGRIYAPRRKQRQVVWRDHRLVALGVSVAVRFVLVLIAVTTPLVIHKSTILLDVEAGIPLIVFATSFAALTVAGGRSQPYRDILHETMSGGLHLVLAALVAFPTTLVNHLISAKSGQILGETFLGGLAAVLAAAVLSRMIFRLFRRSLSRRVLVIGDGSVARDVAERLAQDPFVDPVDVLPISDSEDELARVCQLQAVDVLLVVLPWGADLGLQAIVDRLHHLPIDVRVFPDFSEFRQVPTSVSALGGMPVLGIADRPLEGWAPFQKRAEDLMLGLVLLVLSLPLALLIAICIRLDSPGPILFRQPRVGYRTQLFEILKFRTMHVRNTDVDAARLVAPGDPRVTRVGGFLRAVSLDELPQLINVMIGDMSLVGPRPHALLAKAGNVLYPEAVERYTARFRVRPGITGLAQINGWRGLTDTVDKICGRVEHDLYYINNWSLRLDLIILLKTGWAVISRKNAV